MAITVEARTSIIELVVGMFGAAPGASVLSDLVAAYEAGMTIKQMAANLANTNEFKGIFQTFLTNGEFATKVVNQLLAEASTTAKSEAVTVLTAELNGGMSRSDAFVAAINFVNGTASTNTTYGTSAAAFDNKVEVATYYSVEKALSGSSLQALQNVVGAVTSSATTVTTAKASVDNVQNPGTTFTFTTGVDDLKGGSGDDVFNATVTSTSATLGGLDVADGGTGNDTFNVVDTAVAAGADLSLPAGLSIKNIETLKITTNGALGTAATALDLSGITGLTSFEGAAAGAGTATSSHVKVAGTTDAKLTVAGANTATVTGGKDVSIIAGTGNTSFVGNATGTSSASVKGGGTVTLTGNSMKSITMDAVGGATASLTSTGMATVTIKNQIANLTTTITNATSTALTVNVDGSGYTAVGGSTAATNSVVAGSAAATITVNATGTKSNITVSGAAAKTLNITGTAALTLAAPITTATLIDGSTSTGALTLGTLNAATLTTKTGSGNDSLTLSATAAATVDTGAGNDSVTLGSAVAAGSKITLGAGNDKLLSGGGSVATSTSTSLDAGDGEDSVSANLINAGNAGQFKNFEKINLDSTTGLDLALLTGNTITGLTISNTSTTATYQNVKIANGLTVDLVSTGAPAGNNTLSFSDASGTADTYTVTFAGATTGTPGSANVRAGTLNAAGIENFSIVSGGTSTWNEITLGASAQAKTVTITGAAKLDLAFVAGFGTAGATTGVTSIDGSAATGALVINTTNVNVTTGSAGLTVKGGSAADTITLAGKATVDAGAGNDSVTVSANGGAITTGAGNDSVNVSAAVVGTATPAGAVITSITDLAAGDKIVFANLGTEVFTTTKVNVNTATALIGGTTNALDLAAAAGDSTTNGQITWFQYAGDTYIVEELGANAAVIGTDDIVIKLTGLIDLSTATYDAASNTLTIV